MQPCSTILGIIEMRLRGISYDDCRRRYGVGNSTITLIMDRYKTHGISLDDLKKLSATDVESAFYPPDNIRRKAENANFVQVPQRCFHRSGNHFPGVQGVCRDGYMALQELSGLAFFILCFLQNS